MEIEEHLLLMPVIIRMAGRDFALPVIGQAHALQLGAHRGDILIGPFGGMDLVLDGGVLRRQAEGVPAHRMQHVEAARLLVARHHIAQRVVADMAHMDAPRRVGEHLQHVIFRPGGVFGHVEAALLRPDALPLCLGFLEIIACHLARPDLSRVRVARFRPGLFAQQRGQRQAVRWFPVIPGA